jgi:hypothetical protein
MAYRNMGLNRVRMDQRRQKLKYTKRTNKDEKNKA